MKTTLIAIATTLFLVAAILHLLSVGGGLVLAFALFGAASFTGSFLVP